MYDLKIENTRICRGLGNTVFYGAVAVEEGRIAAVETYPSRPSSRTVDGNQPRKSLPDSINQIRRVTI